MSLLEDIFLQDEANEAQQLERVIEGDEFEERLRSDSDENSEKEDEAEEDKRRVDPATTKTKRVVRNPRFILNPARLSGPRGIQVIPDHFKDFKFKGKGNEKEDLDLVLKKLEHWAYRLYPKFQFGDCLKKIETLGKKRPVMVHLHKIRSDQYVSEETVVQRDSSDDEDTPAVPQEEDEFDRLLQQQIDLARSTPAPSSVRKPENIVCNGIFTNPKATSSPSISGDQRERMIRNRQLAEEKRLARLKNIDNNSTLIGNTQSDTNKVDDISNIVKEVGDGGRSKKNRLSIIDSSDEEDITIVESVTIDNHSSINTTNIRSIETVENEKDLENNGIDDDQINSGDVVSQNLNSNNVLDQNSTNDSEDINSDNIIDKNCLMTISNTEINKAVEKHSNTNYDDIVLCDLNTDSAGAENLSVYNVTRNQDNTDSHVSSSKIVANKDTYNVSNCISEKDIVSSKKGEDNISSNEIVCNGNSEKELFNIKPVLVETDNLDKSANEENETNVDQELMDVDFSDDF